MRRPFTIQQFTAATVFMLLLVIGAGIAAAADNSAELLGFKITFEGMVYDPVKDESTWTYRVNGLYEGPHDLSHWRLALCLPNHIVPGEEGNYKTSHPHDTKVDTDKHTNFHGIKFDVKVNKNGGDTIFWFVLKGNWEIGPVVVGGKAGQPTESGMTVPGPTCQTVMCQLNVDVSHYNTDWRIMRPGTYATKMATVYLTGNGGAQITFDNFGDIQYIADNSAPGIAVKYAFGETLPAPDSSDWMSAVALNEMIYTVGAADVVAGYELTLWGRVHLAGFNYSSEYERTGHISVSAICLPAP